MITALTNLFFCQQFASFDKKKCHMFPNTNLVAAERFSSATSLVLGKGGRAS